MIMFRALGHNLCVCIELGRSILKGYFLQTSQLLLGYEHVLVYSNLVNVILRRDVVVTWIRENRESMNVWHYGITKSQHCNNDNIMCVSLWFEFFGWLPYCQNPWCKGGKCDNKEEYFILAHPFYRILGHKRGSDIMEGDIMELGCTR